MLLIGAIVVLLVVGEVVMLFALLVAGCAASECVGAAVLLLAILTGAFNAGAGVDNLGVAGVMVVVVANTDAKSTAGAIRNIDMFISLFGKCVIPLLLYAQKRGNASESLASFGQCLDTR